MWLRPSAMVDDPRIKPGREPAVPLQLRYLGTVLPGRERGRRYSRCHSQRRWALRVGQIATAYGILPTVMGADTAPVAVVITDTVPSMELVT